MAKEKVKQVIFTDKDINILRWSEKKGKPFSSYVKDLIREDMSRHSMYNKNELESIVKDIIKNMNLEVKQPDIEEKKGLGNKGKAALKNILKR